jgi:glycosyltransferase involved in cell wall biosynthesis
LGRSPKPRLLVVFYGNPDYYASITRELCRLRADFSIHLVCANGRELGFAWPADIAIERVGRRRAFGPQKFAARIAAVLDYLRFAAAVRRRMRRFAPALLHAHDARAFVTADWFRRRGHPPIVYQVRDVTRPEDCSRFTLQHWIERRALKRGPHAALVIHSESERAADYARRSGDPRPPLLWPMYPSLDLIPRPADFEALIERRFARRELLYTGVIGPGIAAAEALRAIADLAPPVTLTLYGSIAPGDLRELRRLAQMLGLGDRATHHGWIPLRALLDRTLEAAVGLVLFKPGAFNYRWMGTSTNKLYEYVARGIPVLVPDTPSFHRALAGEAWVGYADLDAPASIAREIGRLLADRDRYSQACRAARRAFEERYNFERVFPAVLERLRALTESRRSLGIGGPLR